MCGIAGFWPLSKSLQTAEIAGRMTGVLKHRGPNARGEWTDERAGLTLVHTRLSILDLSPAGAQPMISASGRYVLSFNGEIYNHAALRALLEQRGESVDWRGHSDTETLLAATELLGLDEALRLSRGMFAIALWDRHERKLALARDRFGEKPLYWSAGPRGLVFASELKAMLQSGLSDTTLSRNAAAALLRYNHIPAPHTVYEHVNKLCPGQIMEFTEPVRMHTERRYWSVFETWSRAKNEPFAGTEQEAVDQVEAKLTEVIRGQMLSDVSLGAFLSGGIDSSLVVALMQKASTQKVRTFSIGFEEQSYNEADSAKAVAEHLGTEHRELYVGPRGALDVIPHLPDIYCEPFADSSQLPTYLVAKFAREHVTVALTGDGGDEVFGGYNRYLFAARVYPQIEHLPMITRRAIASFLRSLRPEQWDRLGSRLRGAFPTAWQFQDPGDKIMKLARSLSASSAPELYEGFLVQWWPDPVSIVPGATTSLRSSNWEDRSLQRLEFIEQMMLQDAIAYLPNDILVKVDRAAMAASIEGRIPFLDHELYALAAALPAKMKVRDGQTKWVVREALYRHVPRILVDRAKTGFGVPIHSWLRNELRDWAESLLSEGELTRVGMFDPKPVRRAWRLHLSGRQNLQHPLWCVLMYQAWHRRWASCAAAA